MLINDFTIFKARRSIKNLFSKKKDRLLLQKLVNAPEEKRLAIIKSVKHILTTNQLIAFIQYIPTMENDREWCQCQTCDKTYHGVGSVISSSVCPHCGAESSPFHTKRQVKAKNGTLVSGETYRLKIESTGVRIKDVALKVSPLTGTNNWTFTDENISLSLSFKQIQNLVTIL